MAGSTAAPAARRHNLRRGIFIAPFQPRWRPQYLNAVIILLTKLERLPMAPMRLKGSLLLAMPKPRIGWRDGFDTTPGEACVVGYRPGEHRVSATDETEESRSVREQKRFLAVLPYCDVTGSRVPKRRRNLQNP